MNWKNVLSKGLPVLGVTIALLIVFVVMSRPKAVPKVSNPKDLVVDFQDLEITRNELYELMKNANNPQTRISQGLTTLLREVDYVILDKYFAEVDEATLDEQIDKLKGDDEQAYLDNLTILGYTQRENESDQDFEARVKKYYKYSLNLVQKAAAEDRAERELTENEITEAKDAYHEDVCIIPLKFSNSTENDAAKAALKNLQGDALKQKVLEYYKQQNPDFVEENDQNGDEQDFFEKQITCNYERAVYNDITSTTYRDFIFNIPTGTIGTQLINSTYNIVYKAGEATPIEQYTEAEQAEFTNIIKEQLVTAKVTSTSTYINETMIKLRNDAGLKIFDYMLAEQYAKKDADFEVSKSKNKQAVYEINGKVTTADELYNTLKTSNAMFSVLNKVNFAALSTFDKIQLSKDEMKKIEEDILNAKAQYTRGATMPWPEYIKMIGANDEKELANLIALDDLVSRYILGYNGFQGKYEVTQQEIKDMYDEWFELHASHILFKIDENAADINVETKRKETLALQVIRGVDVENDSVYLEPKDFIKYDNNKDGKIDENEYFVGLKNVSAEDYDAVFKNLALRYSDDTGSKVYGGDLDNQETQKGFGPGDMVPEFQAAALKIAEGDYPFSDVDNDTLAKTKFGYHVIYVRGQEEKPAVPAGYETKTIDEIKQVLSTETNEDLKAYYDFLVTFNQTLEREHTSSQNQQKYLTLLLNEKGFKFLDTDIQKYFERINAIDLREEEATE